MKIDQLAFIRDLMIEKGLTEYNANIISMKAYSTIKMSELKDYKKTNLYIYQQLIDKLIYLSYGTRLNIVFIIGQLSKHNANLRKSHLQAVKRVVKYLSRTIEMGLVYG